MSVCPGHLSNYLLDFPQINTVKSTGLVKAMCNKYCFSFHWLSLIIRMGGFHFVNNNNEGRPGVFKNGFGLFNQ